MGLFSRIGGFFRRAVSFVQKGLDFLQKPLNELVSKPLSKLLGKVLDKLPFGIGNFVKPFVDKFLNNALSFLAPGGLGILGALTKAIPSLSGLTSMVNTLDNVVGGLQNITQPQARANLAELVAQRHAQLL